jgi:iron(II)-dependent oxidoreductase
VSIGAGPQGFAYDNERARHAVELAPFQIGRAPVTNGDWLEFVDGGGYDSERWWSVEGWAWRNQEGVSAPMSWVVEPAGSTADSRQWRLGELLAIDLDAPVVHVSWFEAQAFANAHGARLPTEFEWEMAATWDPDSGGQRGYPWGDAPLEPERANLDQCAGGPAPIGAFPAGASGAGLMAMIGDVWEWTSSRFEGYPGFVAHPYREYSEQFFGGPSRVLRGGSWATRPRVVSTTFRNWDLPQRRQIFAGLRLAKDG